MFKYTIIHKTTKRYVQETKHTSVTTPGSCQTSVRKLWASLAAVQWGWGQGWKMESGQEPRRLGGSPLLWPFEWKAGRWQCTTCHKRTTHRKHKDIWMFLLYTGEAKRPFCLLVQFLIRFICNTVCCQALAGDARM